MALENKNKRTLGSMGEKFALDYLTANNYKLLAQNYRVGRLGEIDIIARENEYICFIEVKARSSALFGTPAEAVGRRKQENIRKLASIYLDRHQMQDQCVRFDIVEVIFSKAGEGFNVKKINLIKDAF